jgi:uncharacterized protein (TIRG00374 family)
MRRTGPLLIAVALLGAALVPLALGGKGALGVLAQIPPGDYAIIAAGTLLGWIARAAKLGLLMRRLRLRASPARIGAISLATEFAFLATPGGIGGYAAGIHYGRSVGASFACASSITAADQLLDSLLFGVALPLAALCAAQTLPAGLREAALISSVLLFFGLIALICTHRRLGRWLFAENGPLARVPFVRRHLAAAREFGALCAQRMRDLASGGPLFLIALAACTSVQWLTRYGLLWLILWQLGANVSFALLFMLQGVVLHAAAWTGVPSGGGGADLGLAATLAPFVPATDLASALLLWRFATLYLPLAAGFLAMLALQRRAPRTVADDVALATR